jgi:hypothetical protein
MPTAPDRRVGSPGTACYRYARVGRIARPTAPRPTGASRVPHPTARGERSHAEAKRSQRATHNYALPTRPPFVASRCRSVARATPPTTQRLCSFLSCGVCAPDPPSASTRRRHVHYVKPQQPRSLTAATSHNGENRVSCVRGRQTSRQAIAGPGLGCAARRRSYTPPMESRSSGPRSVDRQVDDSAMPEMARSTHWSMTYNVWR